MFLLYIHVFHRCSSRPSRVSIHTSTSRFSCTSSRPQFCRAWCFFLLQKLPPFHDKHACEQHFKKRRVTTKSRRSSWARLDSRSEHELRAIFLTREAGRSSFASSVDSSVVLPRLVKDTFKLRFLCLILSRSFLTIIPNKEKIPSHTRFARKINQWHSVDLTDVSFYSGKKNYNS